MADVHTKEIRSKNMAAIKGKNTKPEMLVRRFLHAHGYRYRLHDKRLPGKPDIVLPKYKTVIFVHGCFWHGHEGCKLNRIPKNNNYWRDKLINNSRRDKLHIKHIKKQKWKVFIIWECSLISSKSNITLNSLLRKIILQNKTITAKAR
jgi:DNA mismatch endonuclease (patch repair protein)